MRTSNQMKLVKTDLDLKEMARSQRPKDHVQKAFDAINVPRAAYRRPASVVGEEALLSQV